MMSQTHLLIASGLFARPEKRLRNWSVLIGAFIPDAAIYGLVIWSKIQQIPERKVWSEIYWQEPWQSYTAAGNSIPLYLTLLLIGVFLLRAIPAAFRFGVAATLVALAALTHIAGDFPVHVTDAHRHLWPVSDWKFVSAVSYWNPNHYGNIFFAFEILLGISLCVILARRFKHFYISIALALLSLAYIAVPIYFSFQMEH